MADQPSDDERRRRGLQALVACNKAIEAAATAGKTRNGTTIPPDAVDTLQLQNNQQLSKLLARYRKENRSG